MFYKIIYWLIYGLAKIVYWFKFVGLENIPQGAAIICGNHTANVDAVLAILSLGSTKQHAAMAKEVQLISPFLSKEPNLVLIEARKNANPRLKFCDNLFVYEKQGVYTEQINQIYSSFALQDV